MSLSVQIHLNQQFRGLMQGQVNMKGKMTSSALHIDIDCLASDILLASIQSGRDMKNLSEIVRKRCGKEPFPSINVMEAALKKRLVSALNMYEIVIRECQEMCSLRK